MSAKQDRQGVRTATDLERKYQFDKQFAEIMGIATDARDTAYAVESELRSEILEQVTSLTRNTEEIIMTALESYVEKEDLDELKVTMESEFKVMAEQIAMNFDAAIQGQITDTNGEVQNIQESLEQGRNHNWCYFGCRHNHHLWQGDGQERQSQRTENCILPGA